MKERLQNSIHIGNRSLDETAKAAGLLKYVLQRMNEEKFAASTSIKVLSNHTDEEHAKLQQLIKEVASASQELADLRANAAKAAGRDAAVQVRILHCIEIAIHDFIHTVAHSFTHFT